MSSALLCVYKHYPPGGACSPLCAGPSLSSRRVSGIVTMGIGKLQLPKQDPVPSRPLSLNHQRRIRFANNVVHPPHQWRSNLNRLSRQMVLFFQQRRDDLVRYRPPNSRSPTSVSTVITPIANVRPFINRSHFGRHLGAIFVRVMPGRAPSFYPADYSSRLVPASRTFLLEVHDFPAHRHRRPVATIITFSSFQITVHDTSFMAVGQPN